MKNVAVFINGELGLNILNFLKSDSNTKLVTVVINNFNKRSENYKYKVQTRLAGILEDSLLFEFSSDLWDRPEFRHELKKANFGISSLFGHIIPRQILEHFGPGLINLHPSLLPIGRGADPVFWAKIEGLPQGVTIHQIDKGIDTGPILAQREYKSHVMQTSGEIYRDLTKMLYELFVEFYPSWELSAYAKKQEGKSTYHNSSQMEKIRKDLLVDSSEILKIANLIQALTYDDGRSARISVNSDEIWSLGIQAKRQEEEN